MKVSGLVKKVLFGTAFVVSTFLSSKLNAQTPVWYDAFSPKNEVVNYFGSYGSGDVDQDGDVDWDDNAAMDTIKNFYSDVDGDDDQSTAKDKKLHADYLNGIIKYLPAEFWRSTPSEKEGWVRNIYPIMTRLNNYTYNTSADPDKFFDSDRFSVGDFLTGNGYSPDRDDFHLIHDKYNLKHNGLFNLPIYIARVHSDDGTWNHGFSVVNKGTNLKDPNSWIFLEPQRGEIMEPGPLGSSTVPFNSKIYIYGVKNFKDSNIPDEPRLVVATELRIDSQGNREIKYINPNMVLDQTSLSIEGESANTSNPPNYSLGNNYPDPFNSSTNIPYEVHKQTKMSLDLYDMKGRHIKNLEKGVKYPGSYIETLDASNLSSGNYLAVFKTPEGIQSEKISLVK